MVLLSRLAILLVISFLLFQLSVQAQIKNSYNFGSIGMTGSKLSTFSGPVLINGSSCFSIRNGVNDFAKTKQGIFENSCTINSAIVPISINFICYPNPVVTSFFIKAKNVLGNDVTPLTILFNSLDGKQVLKLYTNMQILSSGYFINASSLAAGEYAIKILANNQSAAIIKMIKVH
jgi:hypothetical protein